MPLLGLISVFVYYPLMDLVFLLLDICLVLDEEGMHPMVLVRKSKSLGLLIKVYRPKSGLLFFAFELFFFELFGLAG